MKTWQKVEATAINLGNVVELDGIIVSVQGKRVQDNSIYFNTDHGAFKVNKNAVVDVYR